MFYIIYIKKTFDWSKNEWIGITILQVGKLRLHELSEHKHFSIAATISPDSKRENIFLLSKYHPFEPLTWLIEVLVFPYLGLFSCQPCKLVVLSSSSFLAGDLQSSRSFEINT